MLHISICDDEPVIADGIRKIIELELEKQKITANIEMFSNGEEFLSQYKMRNEELIFLDIDMPVKNGIEVLREMEAIGMNERIILVTNHDNMILESLSFGPYQTIRKCNMEKDIPKALQRYARNKRQREDWVEFSGKGVAYHVNRNDIEYLEKYRHNIIVHLYEKEPFTIRGNIQEYEEELSGSGFLRIHTGYIVNLKRSYSVEKQEVILHSGVRLPISRERLKLVKEQFLINRRY